MSQTPNSPPTTPPPKTEILIIGAGPVGLSLALALSLHTPSIEVTIIDALPRPGTASRALVYHPFVRPLFAQLGVWDRLRGEGALQGMPSFRCVETGELLLDPPARKGGDRDGVKEEEEGGMVLVLPQWRVERALEAELVGRGGKVCWGCEIVGLQQEREYVDAKIRSAEGEVLNVRARYLVGADGGRSAVRKMIGVEYRGETLPAQCVACDVRFPFEDYGFGRSQLLVDPEAYGIVAKIGREDAWRVSFGAGLGASEEEIRGLIPKRFEAMFPRGAPRPLEGTYEMLNVAPYKCHQLCVGSMVEGRVCLVGDAAHLTNPYAGLGLSSGLFDASSLAPILTAILQRSAPAETLLAAWSRDRIRVFWDVVDPLSRANFNRARDPEPATLGERDMMFKAVKAGKKPPPITLGTRVEALEGWVA